MRVEVGVLEPARRMGTQLLWTLTVLVLHCCASTAEPPPSTSPSPAPADSTTEFLRLLCGFNELPKPWSRVEFIGELQRANTSRNSYGYYRFGNSTSGRPPLVLIAGLGATIRMWAPSSLRAAAGQQEIIAFDNPGIGFTQELFPGAANLSVEGMAEDALELIDVLQLEKPNVFGSSMGGMVAAAMAALAGDRLGKIVLGPGSAGSPASQGPAPELAAKALAGTATPLDMLRAQFPVDLPEGLEGLCRCQHDIAGGIVDPGNAEAQDRQLQAYFDFLEGPGVWDLLPNISNPVLLAGGALDPLIPPQNLKAMASRLQSPWLVIYPRAAHAAICQELDSFLEILDNFLENA